MAHIPDGFLSAPVLVGTAVASAGALALASRRTATGLGERQAPLLGAATAFVFAAQMFNFPLGAGTSAHLLGGVLVAVMAGPWTAMLALFSVVLIQALLFQDGGIAALGANTLNLAVLGAGGGWLVYRWLLALTGEGRRRRLAAAGGAAFAAAVGTGVAVGAQLGLSGLVPLRTAVLAVGGAHLLVGGVEAALTVGILSFVLRSRPELLAPLAPAGPGLRTAAVMGAAAVLVAAGAAAWSSSLPDALEAAAAGLGLGGGSAPADTPVAGNGALAGVGGVAAAFGVAWLGFRALRLAGRARARPG